MYAFLYPAASADTAFVTSSHNRKRASKNHNVPRAFTCWLPQNYSCQKRRKRRARQNRSLDSGSHAKRSAHMRELATRSPNAEANAEVKYVVVQTVVPIDNLAP